MNNTKQQEKLLCGLHRIDFQKQIDNKTTDLYILKNKLGMEVATTNFGCAIVAIMVPDNQGIFRNVILSHDSIDGLISSPEPFLSVTIGRYGNRIGKGQFHIDGKLYQLTINNGPNSLHGGPTGFHKRVWEAHQIDKQTIEYSYLSVDREEGFPGNLRVVMTYHLCDDRNAIEIRYKASTDHTTPVNLTNHAFFNLAGISNPTPSILNNILTIHADHYIPIDEFSIPTGEIRKVEGTPMDFRDPHVVGERINNQDSQLINGTGYDHCYVLNKPEKGQLTHAVNCVEPQGGITLDMYTTELGVQLYTGNFLSGFTGTHGSVYPSRSAICFEAQCFPDSPNRPYFPTALLRPGEEYSQTTIYQFGVTQ